LVTIYQIFDKNIGSDSDFGPKFTSLLCVLVVIFTGFSMSNLYYIPSKADKTLEVIFIDKYLEYNLTY